MKNTENQNDYVSFQGSQQYAKPQITLGSVNIASERRFKVVKSNVFLPNQELMYLFPPLPHICIAHALPATPR